MKRNLLTAIALWLGRSPLRIRSIRGNDDIDRGLHGCRLRPDHPHCCGQRIGIDRRLSAWNNLDHHSKCNWKPAARGNFTGLQHHRCPGRQRWHGASRCDPTGQYPSVGRLSLSHFDERQPGHQLTRGLYCRGNHTERPG